MNVKGELTVTIQAIQGALAPNKLDDDRGRDLAIDKIQQLQASESRKNVPRSCSDGMGRIDEDRASSFRDDTFIFASTDVLRDSHQRLF
ncbi:hypothetical protein Tco_0397522 [Tanacetum coccineum]